MKVGIVGLPGAGKTSVFTALTGVSPDPAAPAGRQTLGVARALDPRLDRLHAMFPREKAVHVELTFADVAGAGGRRSLDRSVLVSMRDFDALAQVLRDFAAPGTDPPDPVREMRDLDAELVLADLDVVDRKHARLGKGEKQAFAGEKELIAGLKEILDAGTPLRDAGLADEQRGRLSGYAFLSLKPVLYVLNVEESRVAEPAQPEVTAAARERRAGLVVVSGEVERQIAELDEAERAGFMADLGLSGPAAARFAAAAFAALDLVTFFTIGDREVRAWTVRRGTTAQAAAGKIHTDMERGFIRADVIRFEDMEALGSEARRREAGKLRVEGRTYIVQDGDIVHVRFGKG